MFLILSISKTHLSFVVNYFFIDFFVNLLRSLKPTKSYISIPKESTALKWILPAHDQALNMAFQISKENVSPGEYLIGSEGDQFGDSGNIKVDSPGITSVHPMLNDALRGGLSTSEKFNRRPDY
jgi:wyosine [tRNA(Phe)-imidazoG37] synthetase (radical SAM superfamily)